MSWYPQKRGAVPAPLSFMPEAVDFIGEQRGETENELKTAFRVILAATPTALNAFLARVYRGNASTPSVAVCIRSAIGVDDKLEERLSGAFRARFRRDQQLDVLFLLEPEEQRLREVCAPFYEKRR